MCVHEFKHTVCGVEREREREQGQKDVTDSVIRLNIVHDAQDAVQCERMLAYRAWVRVQQEQERICEYMCKCQKERKQ